MSSEGWIKISRGINEHWIWKDPIKFQWWLDMLITVNFKDGKVNIGNQLIDCKRGQSVLSLQSWGLRWKVDKNRVRNFFVLLEKDGMITHENLSKTTRITICKYESYQGIENAIETQSKRNQNAIKTQPNAIEESKEGKEGKNILLEKETKEIFTKKMKIEKLRFGEFQNVLLTEDEYYKSKEKYGDLLEAMIQKLSSYIKSKGDKYKDHYATFSSWVHKSIIEENQKNGNINSNQKNGNNLQSSNGATFGVQRPAGKQSFHVTPSALFAAMQAREDN